jgi:anaerobic selenocysteine-containing dehydrogenase
MATARTACSLDCFDGCGIVAEVEDGRIVGLRGDPEHPFTRGVLCRKVNGYLDARHYHAERQLHPLRRQDGEWRRISWDDALDLTAERLSAIRERHGSLAVLYHRGNGSMGALKYVMMDRFFNQFGGATEAVGRYCGGEGDRGVVQSLGESVIHDPIDLAENTNLFLVWGRNPAVTNVHMMPVIKQARERGAIAIVIDPVETKSVRYCDRGVHPRPGSDGDLAIGMAKVILAHRQLDCAGIAARSDNFDAYLDAVRSVSMEEICRRCDLPLATIESLALTYADTKPATILLGIGMNQYTDGAQTYRAIVSLAMLTGNLGVPGGGVSYGQYLWRRLRTPEILATAARTSPPRQLPVTKLADSIETAADPPIRAAVFMASNAVNQMPDPEASRRALGRLEFVACADQFLTDTAACADVFLPSTTMLEEHDFLPSYGHLWVQLMRPVTEPAGEARSDLWVLQQLADRLGFGEHMAGSPEEWIDAVTAPVRDEGISHRALVEAGGRLWPSRSPRVPFADGRFPTPSGRFVFPERFEWKDDAPTPEYPLHLLAQAGEKAINSQVAESQQEREGLTVARVHPAVARRFGLAGGQPAALCSPRGRFRVRLVLDDRVRPDTVTVTKGGSASLQRNMNVLVQPRYTAGTGTAYNQNFVRLEAL